MDYEESAQLMTDIAFRGRIKVACMRYAQELLSHEDVNLGLLRWAQSVYASPDGAAGQIQPAVVMHDAVQEAGRDISDDNLQYAVNRTVSRTA